MEHFTGVFGITTEGAAVVVRETTRSDVIKGNNQNDTVVALGFSTLDVRTGTMSEKIHLQVRGTCNERGISGALKDDNPLFSLVKNGEKYFFL